jgi:tRNA(fMet)-specific endonuclease VapC
MPARYMLDTDICSYVIRENPRELASVFISHKEDDICISSITYAELSFGLLNNYSERLDRKIIQFVSLVEIIDWTSSAALKYADIRHHLKKSGTPIGNMDMLIAASAMSIDAELVTKDKKHFSAIPNLRIADWL